MSDIIPEAYADVLVAVEVSPRSLLPMSIIELHLFSYLACVLALFRGKAIGDWGYAYALTSEGFPFSAKLEDARRAAVHCGALISTDQGHLCPSPAELVGELAFVKSVSRANFLEDRRQLFRAATQCALNFPVGAIRHAMQQTPGVDVATKLGQRRSLLQNDDIATLYAEHQVVEQVLGPDATDILSPAVVWLSVRILKNEVGNVSAV